ncbi:MAG TPA: outer membrane protein transport protein [Kofleriaceae bacterium]|nr:outer membrane protein transport protein [Kofleriaceae bacterium]
MTKLSLLFVVAGTGVASANAFVINEHDGKATGRADATTATDDGPSSIVYNPGGVAVGEGTQIAIGGSLVLAHGGYTDSSGAKSDTDNSPAVLPQLYVTSRVHEMIAVGIGFHTPFGLAINWPDSAPTTDVIKTQSLRTYFITPVVGINLNKYVPGLTIGGGLDIVPASVELTQYIFFGDPATGGTRGQAHLGGTATGFGGRAGAMYRPPSVPQLSVGAMWRSSVKEKFSGTGDFDIAAPYRNQLPPDGDISTSLTLPQSAQLGVAVRPMPKLELELDAVWMDWSQFKDLAITVPAMGGGTQQLVTAEDYKNTISVRFGVEYQLPEQHAAVRAGYMYDPTPIQPDTLTAALPDANRHIVTVGGSYQMAPDYGLHLGVLWVLPASQDASSTPYMPTYKGQYDLQALVASLTFAGQFGK